MKRKLVNQGQIHQTGHQPRPADCIHVLTRLLFDSAGFFHVSNDPRALPSPPTPACPRRGRRGKRSRATSPLNWLHRGSAAFVWAQPVGHPTFIQAPHVLSSTRSHAISLSSLEMSSTWIRPRTALLMYS